MVLEEGLGNGGWFRRRPVLAEGDVGGGRCRRRVVEVESGGGRWRRRNTGEQLG